MTLLTTSATSPSRTGAPSRQATVMSRYSAALKSWSLEATIQVLPSAAIVPSGRFIVAARTACRICSSDKFILASSRGEARMRTAGRSAPATLTLATPGSCDSFCAITLSA